MTDAALQADAQTFELSPYLSRAESWWLLVLVPVVPAVVAMPASAWSVGPLLGGIAGTLVGLPLARRRHIRTIEVAADGAATFVSPAHRTRIAADEEIPLRGWPVSTQWRLVPTGAAASTLRPDASLRAALDLRARRTGRVDDTPTWKGSPIEDHLATDRRTRLLVVAALAVASIGLLVVSVRTIGDFIDEEQAWVEATVLDLDVVDARLVFVHEGEDIDLGDPAVFAASEPRSTAIEVNVDTGEWMLGRRTSWRFDGGLLLSLILSFAAAACARAAAAVASLGSAD